MWQNFSALELEWRNEIYPQLETYKDSNEWTYKESMNEGKPGMETNMQFLQIMLFFLIYYIINISC
jgi:hypothetical protein